MNNQPNMAEQATGTCGNPLCTCPNCTCVVCTCGTSTASTCGCGGK